MVTPSLEGPSPFASSCQLPSGRTTSKPKSESTYLRDAPFAWPGSERDPARCAQAQRPATITAGSASLVNIGYLREHLTRSAHLASPPPLQELLLETFV